jgi:hypothetical protein
MHPLLQEIAEEALASATNADLVLDGKKRLLALALPRNGAGHSEEPGAAPTWAVTLLRCDSPSLLSVAAQKPDKVLH